MAVAVSFRKIIKFHGGYRKSFLALLRIDELKYGKFLGKDRLGNYYFENDYYFFGRNRWVIYSDKFGYEYDASYIQPNWFLWMHYVTDKVPSEEQSTPYKWILPYEGNTTGTKDEYVPYSTTRPKISPWIPPKQPCECKKPTSEKKSMS